MTERVEPVEADSGSPDSRPQGAAVLATYRLQFNAEFRLSDADSLVDYFDQLGVSHLYTSPLMRARSQSTHGYDVVDPCQLNPQLGGEEELQTLVERLRARGMGVVLDVVPNHMAATTENPYWQDVLRYGSSSHYARWFDIDWRGSDPEFWGRVSIPILGATLPQVIHRGELTLVWNGARFVVKYYEHEFPLDPASLSQVLVFGIDDLHDRLPAGHPALLEVAALIKRLNRLPKRLVRIRKRIPVPREELEAALTRLSQWASEEPAVAEWARQTAESFVAEDAGRRRLRRLLDVQSYRLVYWRRAARVLNYRRFFDINDLVSLRQEDPVVFAETHELIARWVRNAVIDGLRIDHLDGLRDPERYLQQLNEVVCEAGREGFPIFVEKILAADETLPETWPIAGSTGYEFLNQLESALIPADGMLELEHFYRRLLRQVRHFSQAAGWGKRRVLKSELSSFVGSLARTLHRLALDNDATANVPFRELAETLVEVAVELPVYRTYVSQRSEAVTGPDRHYLESAIARVSERQLVAPEAVDFLAQVLLLYDPDELSDRDRQDRLNFIERFQQITGPAAAKGVEDTALYLHLPLVSRNEVGGEPDADLADAVGELHRCNRARATDWPGGMLCVTTHDTKRSADARARLDVLAQLPKLWEKFVTRWRRWNRPLTAQVSGRTTPEANTEYLFYQTLVSVWPARDPRLEERLPPTEALAELRERVADYMLKAIREAKARTSWVDPNADYEDNVLRFVRTLLSDEDENAVRFLRDVDHCVGRIARPGFWNSLSRTLVLLTAPGVPDIYQGDELWNFALVDPDNRRPVDFELRRNLLGEIRRRWRLPAPAVPQHAVAHHESEAPLTAHPPMLDSDPDDPFVPASYLHELLESAEDGRLKLFLTHAALMVRRRHPELFVGAEYVPLEPEGPQAAHLFGFVRRSGSRALLSLAPRLTTSLVAHVFDPPIGEEVWEETVVCLPEEFHESRLRCALTGRTIAASDGKLPVGSILADFPAGMLIAEGG